MVGVFVGLGVHRVQKSFHEPQTSIYGF